jgi:hypothetical protein
MKRAIWSTVERGTGVRVAAGDRVETTTGAAPVKTGGTLAVAVLGGDGVSVGCTGIGVGVSVPTGPIALVDVGIASTVAAVSGAVALGVGTGVGLI